MRYQRQLGSTGEEIVAQWLEQKGFAIRERNFCTRMGEVDLIVQKNDVLAFVEVKTRTNVFFPISSVITKGKQRKIIRAAKWFIVQNNIVDKVCRFDVAIVVYDNGQHHIDYIENAFTRG